MAVSLVYVVAMVPGLCVGLKREMGEAEGEMGLYSFRCVSEVVDWRIFHHLLPPCWPEAVRVMSLVPWGLTSCPSQKRPCFLSESRADANAELGRSVCSDVSLCLLVGH